MATTTTATTLGLFNATTTGYNTTTSQPVYYQEETWLFAFKFTLFSITFILCMFGNGLLILSILVFKKLRHMESNYLILNLAACDVLTAIFKIPFTLVIYKNPYLYPFGEFGCQSIWPIATYATNSSVFTLVCIAIERYLTISSIRVRVTKAKLMLAILLIHLTSIASVIPYILTLTYVVYFGTPLCYEAWYDTVYERAYTIVLFMLQYGLPLLLIILLYSALWLKIMKRNNKMIKVSEEYERKIAWEASSKINTRDCNSDNTPSSVTFKTSQGDSMNSEHSSVSTGIEAKEETLVNAQPPSYEETVRLIDEQHVQQPYYRRSRASSLRASFNAVPIKTGKVIRRIKMLRKPKYISHTAYVRHRQTIRTLKMFTTIVVVFAVFALPNQVLWLLIQFSPDIKPPAVVVPVFTFFTFLNAMTNCWVYFAFNSSFQKAYKKIFLTVFPCLQRFWKMPHVFSEHDSEHTTISKTNKSISPGADKSIANTNSTEVNSQNNTDYVDRQNAFDDMFNDHLNNFEKYQHLYNTPKTENEENVQTSPKAKYKKSIASLINNIAHLADKTQDQVAPTSPQQKTSTVSRKFTMAPPIIPFAEALASSQNVKKRKTSNPLCTVPKEHQRPKSMVNLDDIDMNDMILRESVEKQKFGSRRRKSASDIGKEREKQREKREQEVRSQPVSPVRKKSSLFALFSPKVSKKSDIKQPILQKMVPGATMQVIAEDNNDNMVSGVEVVVQTETATTNVVKVGTAYAKLKNKVRKKSSHSRNVVFSPLQRQKASQQTPKTSTTSGEVFVISVQDFSSTTDEDIQSSEPCNLTSELKITPPISPPIKQGVQITPPMTHSAQIKTDPARHLQSPLTINPTKMSSSSSTIPMPTIGNEPPSPPQKIPPVVPPKPKQQAIQNHAEKSPKESQSQVSKIHIDRNRDNQPIPSLENRKQRLEEALSDDHRQDRRNSIERRDSVKHLNDRRLVRKRSNSLENKSVGTAPKDDVETFDKKKSLTKRDAINEEAPLLQGNVELNNNITSKMNGHTLKDNSNIDSNNSDQKDNIDHVQNSPINDKKQRKLYKRPDISDLLEHALSLPSLLTAKETLSASEISINSSKHTTINNDNNVQGFQTTNKGELDQVSGEENLSPQENQHDATCC